MTLAIQFIEQDALVLDAALSQDGCSLSLALVVNAAITTEAAQERGDNFVRLVKSFAPQGDQYESPGVQIGRGQYDYSIGVYASGTKARIALGVKPAMARSVSW